MNKIEKLFKVLCIFYIIIILSISANAQLDVNIAKDQLTGIEYVEGEMLVKLKPGVSEAVISDLNSKYKTKSVDKFLEKNEKMKDPGNAKTFENHGFDRLRLLKMPVNTNINDAVKEFNNNQNIEYAAPNYIYHITTIPNDPGYLSGNLWGLNKIQTPQAWDLTKGSADIVVANIDTGVDYDHPDLAPNIWTNPGEIPGNGIDDDGNGYVDDIHGYDFANNDGDPFDDHGHGTHTAGTIGAVGNNGIGVAGVNWNVKIMPVKFLSGSGSGTTTDAIRSIQYAIDNGADIMSNSWGGGGYDPSLEDVIKLANDAGILFVAAAGNNGRNNDILPFYPASYNVPNVISVAATDGNDVRASFSNYGTTSVDLGAPGINILSTIPGGGYTYLSGTSMATPHVAGVAALIKARYPELTSDVIKTRIFNSVDPSASLSGKTVTGGRLNAYKAVHYVQTVPSAPQNLNANAGNARVTLSWNSPLSNGGLAITNYLVYKGTSSGGETFLIQIGNVLNYIDTSVTNGETYYYKVTAANSIGESASSNEISAKPSAPLLHVASITTTTQNAGSGKKKINTYVTVKDSNNKGVPGVTVSIKVKLPSSAILPGSGTTDTYGKVKIVVGPTIEKGTYSSSVDNIVKTGWTFDGIKPFISGKL